MDRVELPALPGERRHELQVPQLTKLVVAVLAAVALSGCGSGDSTRDVPAAEAKTRPNSDSYDGAKGGK